MCAVRPCAPDCGSRGNCLISSSIADHLPDVNALQVLMPRSSPGSPAGSRREALATPRSAGPIRGRSGRLGRLGRPVARPPSGHSNHSNGFVCLPNRRSVHQLHRILHRLFEIPRQFSYNSRSVRIPLGVLWPSRSRSGEPGSQFEQGAQPVEVKVRPDGSV